MGALDDLESRLGSSQASASGGSSLDKLESKLGAAPPQKSYADYFLDSTLGTNPVTGPMYWGYKDPKAMAAAGDGALHSIPMADDMLAGYGALGSSAYHGVVGDDPKGSIASRFEDYKHALADKATQDSTDYPMSYGAGNLAGMGAGMMVGTGEAQGASTLARVGMNMLKGGAYGAAQGFGDGDSLDDRISGGLTEGGMGAVGGGVAPEALGYIGKKGSRWYKTLFDGEGLVNDDLRNAAESHINNYATKVKSQQAAAAAGKVPTPPANPPLMPDEIGDGTPHNFTVGDALGEYGHILGRDAGNASPEAQTMLAEHHKDRLASIPGQLSDTIKSHIDQYKPVGEIRDDLQGLVDNEIDQRYGAAEANPNGQHIWNDELRNAISTSHGRAALKDAINTSGDDAIMGGGENLTPVFNDGADGKLDFGGFRDSKGNVDPNATGLSFRFWDNMKKAIDSKSRVAFRAGDDYNGGRMNGISKTIRSNVDDAVPEYADARGARAKVFGAEDALDAGSKFANMGNNVVKLDDAQKAFNDMGPAEQEMFRRSFADQHLQNIETQPNTALTNMSKPEFMNRYKMIMGDDAANGMADKLGAMQRQKTAAMAFPRSDTARALMHAGVNFGTGATGTWMMGDTNPMDMLGAGAATALAGHAVGAIKNQMINKQRAAWGSVMAKKLMSTDPEDLVKILGGR